MKTSTTSKTVGRKTPRRSTSKTTTKRSKKKAVQLETESKPEIYTGDSTEVKTKVKGKIIFLDIDGVLNCMPDDHRKVWPDFVGGVDERAFGLSPLIIPNLKNLLDRTDAKIVVSSSWRHFDDYEPIAHGKLWRHVLAQRLGRNPDELFLGSTPTCSTLYMYTHGISEYAVRGQEIKKWMDDNEEKVGKPGEDYNFCILDDEVTDILVSFDPKYVVHTNYKTGLTPEDVEKAYHILNFA